MIRLQKTFNIKGVLLPVLIFIFVTNFSIYLDIPFIRQICGFLFLTILPGLLILRIIKLNNIEPLKYFLIMIGISITFIMFFGLLINNVSLGLGYETPLATTPLLICLNTAIIILTAIEYMINKDLVISISNLNFTTSEKAFLIAPILFPVLSAFGMHLMNTACTNVIVLIMLLLISIYFASVCFFNRSFSPRLYPVIIFLISISLLLLLSLRSNHIIGIDTHVEYCYFLTTFDNLHWNAFGKTALDACLSISLLPAIFRSILNMPSEFLFKVLYSLLFSIVPLIIYVMSKKYVGELNGFIASFYFMSLQNFLFTAIHARTNMAILFFALSMMILFDNDVHPAMKRLFFIGFICSCIVSHYSTTYIFFFLMIGMFIGTEFLIKKEISKRNFINLNIILLFITMIFFWYSQVTGVAFDAGINFIGNTFNNLNKFFVEELRGSSTRALMGDQIGIRTVPSKIEFVFTWVAFALIGIGILTLTRKCREMFFQELDFKKPRILIDKFEVPYSIIVLECAGLLVTVVLAPFISAGYSMERVYLLAAILLSVFLCLGGIIATKYLNNILSKILKYNRQKCPAYLITILVLIPYFLCTTGVLYQAFGIPQSIVLNSNGNAYDSMYVHDQDSYGAKWIKRNTNESAKIYGDHFGGLWLLSQGMVQPSNYEQYIIDDQKIIKTGYVYLRYVNLIERKFLQFSKNSFKWNSLTECEYLLTDRDKIYDNNGSQVWN